MHEIEFNESQPPFIPTNGRDFTTDPVILRAVRTALQRTVSCYNLPKWIKQHHTYLSNMYELDQAFIEEFGLDYIWTVCLAYLLAREASATDAADFHSPYLPFALVDQQRSLDAEDLFVLQTAAYAHALLFPVPNARRQQSLAGIMTNNLVVYAASRLAHKYEVVTVATPSLVTSTMLVQATLEANTNTMRWGINIASVTTGYVVTPQALSRPKRDPQKKRRKK